jgi:hypothetical protein
MVFGAKPDFPPLLAPGRHTMTLERVKDICLDRFASNIQRRNLYHALEQFIQAYLVAGLPCNIWIDGSFLTEKPDPSDVDVTVLIDADVTLNNDQNNLIDRTNDNGFGPNVDAFAYQWLPKSHQDYFDEGLNPAITWHELYGVEHSRRWLKGIAVLKVRETHVGLRICS